MHLLEKTAMSIVKPLLRAGGNGTYEVSFPTGKKGCLL